METLRRRAGEPVTYVDLQSAGIEFPGSVVTELELAGVQIDRCETTGPAGQTVRAVRLPVAAADAAGGPPTNAAPETAAPPDAPAPDAPAPVPDAPAAPDWHEVRVYRGSLWLALETAWAELRHPRGGARSAGRARSAGLRRPSSRILLPVAVLVALAASVAVVVAGISGGKADRRLATHARPRTATRAHAGPRRRAAQRRAPAASAPAHASSPLKSAVVASPRASASSPSASSRASTPSAAVQHFYEAAAHHRYSSAWALADANMRSQLDGYARFADQMSSVRSITFHRAEMLGGTGPNVARVGVQTTSVDRTRRRECGGSVRTVRSAAGWLLDGVSISCS